MSNVTISVEEFSQIQNQLVSLRTAQYESKSREEKITSEYNNLKKKYLQLDQEYKKAQGFIQRSKDKNALSLQKENDNLQRTIEVMNNEHREQSEALRNNVHILYQKHTNLQKEFDEMKAEKERLESRLIELKKKDLDMQSQVKELTENVLRLQNGFKAIEDNLFSEKQILSVSSENLIGIIKSHMKLSKKDDNTENSVNVSEESQADSNEVVAVVEEKEVNEKKDNSDASIDTIISQLSINDISNHIERYLKEQIENVRQEVEKYKALEISLPQYIENTATTMTPPSSSSSVNGDQSENSNNENGDSVSKVPLSASSPVQADQDLLNTITRLENQIQDLKKQHETEKENLEQQLAVWREKTKMKQQTLIENETNHKEAEASLNGIIAERNKTLMELKQQLKSKGDEVSQLNETVDSIMKKYSAVEQEKIKYIRQLEESSSRATNLQQMVSNYTKRLKETSASKDRLYSDYVDLQNKVKNEYEPLMEKGKKYDATVDALEREQEKAKKYLEEVSMLKNQEQDMKNQVETLREKIKKLDSNTVQQREQINQLQLMNDSLTKEKEQILQKCVEYVKEMTDKEKILLKEIQVLRDELKNQGTALEKEDEQYIKMFVSESLYKVAQCHHEVLLNTLKKEISALKEKTSQQQESIQKLTGDNKHLKQRVKDAKVEYALELKKSKQLIKELRSQMKAPSMLGSPSPVVMSPKAQHSRTSSSSSDNALRRTSSASSITMANGVGPETPRQAGELEIAFKEVQKENNVLLKRVGDLQTHKWKLEERVRLLEENVMLLHEDVEKKTQIIQHYVQRERTGRLSSEQDKHREQLSKKSSSFMGSLFSGAGSGSGSSSPASQGTNISKEVYARMQQVMEETLLHNIQLQRDLKTMGAEVGKLIRENGQLKKYSPTEEITKGDSEEQS